MLVHLISEFRTQCSHDMNKTAPKGGKTPHQIEGRERRAQAACPGLEPLSHLNQTSAGGCRQDFQLSDKPEVGCLKAEAGKCTLTLISPCSEVCAKQKQFGFDCIWLTGF